MLNGLSALPILGVISLCSRRLGRLATIAIYPQCNQVIDVELNNVVFVNIIGSTFLFLFSFSLIHQIIPIIPYLPVVPLVITFYNALSPLRIPPRTCFHSNITCTLSCIMYNVSEQYT